MNKILKWFLIVAGVVIGLPIVAFIIYSVTSPRDSEGHNIQIQGMRNDARGNLVVAYIKSAELSVLMFQEEKIKLPDTLSDLSPYNPSIDKIKQASVRYTKIDENNFSLCGPYSKQSSDQVGDTFKTWSVSSGEICLKEKMTP